MRTQTLASAFQAALFRSVQDPAVAVPPGRQGVLLEALKRSATGMDEIVQRRIGLTPEGACLGLH